MLRFKTLLSLGLVLLLLVSCAEPFSDNIDPENKIDIDKIYEEAEEALAKLDESSVEISTANGVKTLEVYKGDTSIVCIPEGVTNVSTDAFTECGGIGMLYLPKSVTNFSKMVFRNEIFGVSKLVYADGTLFITKENFPQKGSAEYKIENGNGITTSADMVINELILPKSLESIDPSVLYMIKGLENIFISDENLFYTSVDGVLFTKDMKTLVKYPSGKTAKEYTVPDGVEHIYGGAFFENEYLEEVHLPESLKTIGMSSFIRCKKLSSLNVPDSVSEIGNDAFVGCIRLDKVEMKEGTVKELKEVFYGTPWYAKLIGAENGKITTEELDDMEISDIVETVIIDYVGATSHFVMPEGIHWIKNHLGFMYSYITEVTLSNTFLEYCYLNGAYDGLGVLGYELSQAFPYATALHVPKDCPSFYEKDGAIFVKRSNDLVAFPAGRTGEYEIPAETKKVENNAFYYTSLESIIVPKHVESFGIENLHDADNLKKIVIENKDTEYRFTDPYYYKLVTDK